MQININTLTIPRNVFKTHETIIITVVTLGKLTTYKPTNLVRFFILDPDTLYFLNLVRLSF